MSIDEEDIMKMIIVGIIFFLFLSVFSCALTHKDTTIIDTITKIENGHDYMTISFKNNGTYNVAYPENNNPVIFTIGDKINIKLDYSNFLFFTNTNDCWNMRHCFILERGK